VLNAGLLKSGVEIRTAKHTIRIMQGIQICYNGAITPKTNFITVMAGVVSPYAKDGGIHLSFTQKI